MVRRLFNKLLFPLRRRRFERELRDEMDFHREMLAVDKARAGLDSPAADLAARRQLGNLTRAREDSRDPWVFASLEAIVRDVSLALRSCLRNPAVPFATILTLGLGIGASTAVFAVFNHVLFRPIPGVGTVHGLVNIWILAEPSWMTSVERDHFDALERVPALAGVASHMAPTYPVSLGEHSDPVPLDVEQVTLRYFDILEVRPYLGRFFTPEEHQPGRGNVVVVSEHFWQTRLGGDPAAVGSRIRISGHPFTIVGVTRRFRGIDRVSMEDLWVPRSASVTLDGKFRDFHQFIIGRLRPGASIEQAQQQARVAFDGVGPIEQRDPTDRDGHRRLVYRPSIFSGLEDGVGHTRQRLLSLFWMATAGVAMLFLLACANAANLLVARNVRRHRETGLKLALGVSRLRMWRELMMEAGVLAALAVATGVLVGQGITRIFRGSRLIDYLPPLDDLALDWRVAAFAAGAGVGTVFLAAALPSMMAARSQPQVTLREFARGSASGKRLRNALLVVQVALSIVLGASAGVIARTLQALTTVDLGFRPEELYSVSLRPMDIGYDDRAIMSFFRTVEQRLATTPGIDAAAFTFSSHLEGKSIGHLEAPAGSSLKAPLEVLEYEVSSDYFRTMGIPLRAGRVLTPAEVARDADPGVAIIDEALAQRLFGAASPIGATITWEPAPGFGIQRIRREVIGIVGNTRSHELRERPQPSVYVAGNSMRIATFRVRSRLPRGEATLLIRNTIREIEPQLAGTPIGTTYEDVVRLTAEERVLTKISGVLAALALAFAVSGAFTVVTCGISERVKEFGIRIALGATRRDIAVETLRSVARAGAIGTAAGFVAYSIATRWLSSRLFEITVFDPMTIVVLFMVLLGAVLASTLRPILIATRTDPAVTLRAE